MVTWSIKDFHPRTNVHKMQRRSGYIYLKETRNGYIFRIQKVNGDRNPVYLQQFHYFYENGKRSGIWVYRCWEEDILDMFDSKGEFVENPDLNSSTITYL